MGRFALQPVVRGWLSLDGGHNFGSLEMMAHVQAQEITRFGRRMADSNRDLWRSLAYKASQGTCLSSSKQNKLVRAAGLEPAGQYVLQTTASTNSATPGQCRQGVAFPSKVARPFARTQNTLVLTKPLTVFRGIS